MIGMESNSVSLRLTVREIGLLVWRTEAVCAETEAGGWGKRGRDEGGGEKAELISYNPSSNPGRDW